VHWIDENLPIQYASKEGDLEDIRTGFGYLSKADLYLGRVKKRQNYRMWRYASMLMVCGTAVSKTRSYPGFIKYQQPSLWKRLGQTRSKRDLRDNIASKIGGHSFESMRYSRSQLLELYSQMLKDEKTAIEITAGLRLELEELIYLSGSTKASKKLQKIYDEAQELLLEGSEEAEEEFFKTPASSDNNKQILLSSTAKPQEKKDRGSPGESETSNSSTSGEKQKTLTLGLDLFPATSADPRNLGTKKSDDCVSDNLIPDKFASDGFILDISKPDNFTSDSFKPHNLKTVEKNVLLRSDSLENEDFSGSQPIDSKISTKSSEQKVFAKGESVVEKIPEPKLVSPEIETEEVTKKTEPKSQKTLFDF
jgi:replication factor C large subunit